MRKATLTAEPEIAPLDPNHVHVPAKVSTRIADYLELTKPRIAVMALFTVAIGYLMAAGSAGEPLVLLHTLIGAGLVAAGGSALNQCLEREIDSRMRRTANRPLPAGRLLPDEAFAFGLALGTIGFIYLLLTVHELSTAIAAASTFLLYVCVYTPMKTRTVWNTIVGAVPGALPPVIGWCAARGTGGFGGAMGLFLILFFWQLPHFLAIAWMYRDDYARGGLRMLPGADPTGRRTAGTMILTAAMLIPVSLLPIAMGLAGWVYGAGAIAWGIFFTFRAIQFGFDRTDRKSRTVLRASLLYLPAVLGLLLITRLA